MHLGCYSTLSSFVAQNATRDRFPFSSFKRSQSMIMSELGGDEVLSEGHDDGLALVVVPAAAPAHAAARRHVVAAERVPAHHQRRPPVALEHDAGWKNNSWNGFLIHLLRSSESPTTLQSFRNTLETVEREGRKTNRETCRHCQKYVHSDPQIELMQLLQVAKKTLR